MMVTTMMTLIMTTNAGTSGTERDPPQRLLSFMDAASSSIRTVLHRPTKAKRRVNHRRYLQKQLSAVVRPPPPTIRVSAHHQNRSIGDLFENTTTTTTSHEATVPLRRRNFPASFFVEPVGSGSTPRNQLQPNVSPCHSTISYDSTGSSTESGEKGDVDLVSTLVDFNTFLSASPSWEESSTASSTHRLLRECHPNGPNHDECSQLAHLHGWLGETVEEAFEGCDVNLYEQQREIKNNAISACYALPTSSYQTPPDIVHPSSSLSSCAINTPPKNVLHPCARTNVHEYNFHSDTPFLPYDINGPWNASHQTGDSYDNRGDNVTPTSTCPPPFLVEDWSCQIQTLPTDPYRDHLSSLPSCAFDALGRSLDAGEESGSGTSTSCRWSNASKLLAHSYGTVVDVPVESGEQQKNFYGGL